MATKKGTQTVRDIRPDLRERIRRAVLAREDADAEILMLTKLLDREEREFGSNNQRGKSPPSLSLPLFILGQLRMKDMSKDDMRIYAQDAGYKADGRSIHATVVNLRRGGKISEIAPGLYTLDE
jgi:hypothetical protein